jgi:hypothetical protein
MCQLMVQETVAVMDERYQAQAKEREEARLSQTAAGDSTVASVAGEEDNERIELSVKEYVEFA